MDVGGEMPGFNAAVLSGAHNNSTTTITLTATVPTAWPTAGWVTIDSEIIQYAGKSGATLTSCTRGAQSTYGNSVAASHSDQAQVLPALTPLQWNQLVADLITLEKWEGNATPVATIASSGTTDLSTVTSRYVQVTGTTTITAFGTVSFTRLVILEFAGALTLTHNATSLILRAGANATTAAGDIYAFVSEGSGNWREVWHLVGTATLPDSDPTLQTAYHHFHFEPTNTTAPNVVVVGTGAVSGTSRGIQMATGVTNPSSASIRVNLEGNGTIAGSPGNLISKMRRLEIQSYIADVFANSNAYLYLTDESADTAPSATARHFGVKNLNGTVSFTTADGTTEQTTAITGFVTAGTGANIVITFDGVTARCYIDGTLRATHATNVPAAGTNAVFRAFINNNATANARNTGLHCVDALMAN